LRAAVFELAAKGSTPRKVENGRDVPGAGAAEQLDARTVCRQVCNLTARQFGLTAGEIRGRSRCKSVAEARAVAMYVARDLTGASYGKIGKQFGGRDHTTVLHACKKVALEIEHDSMVRRLTEELARQVTEA
jgi:chromosomal replication initiator protein